MTVSRILFVALLAPAAAGKECGSSVGARTCLARESALLQHSRSKSTQQVALRSPVATCETCTDVFVAYGGCEALRQQDDGKVQEIHQLPELGGCLEKGCKEDYSARCSQEAAGTAHVQCNVSCALDYKSAGGCTAWQKHLQDKVFDIGDVVGNSGCKLNNCGDVMLELCSPDEIPEGLCEGCVARFDAAGGCKAMRAELEGSGSSEEDVASYIPEGCLPCGEDAMLHCMGDDAPIASELKDCSTCLPALGRPGACSALSEGRTSEVPAECVGMDEYCLEEALAQCAAASGQQCHTAQKGEDCFMHVRWAMETGIALHPEWYPSLSRQSSFEDFQMRSHQQKLHDCPEPCSEVPESICHTAAPGEVCYRHVIWAMRVGTKTLPKLYPATLNKDSSFESFQAWLHRIHHGGCRTPCEATSV